ncbi:general transcription factor IIF subunit 1 [Stomoxys calcitrans]|uniref:Transcription initiation factor IIF subunit alpha n=1 Tax=Stomoxys calcitrans TaxID=35570 RepID=A0A1I8NU84_STOCA|nr:general transcription factor IIF subunit 1 [Stomoxys calcitrans]
MSGTTKQPPSTSSAGSSSTNANGPSTSASTPPANVQEFKIRVPKSLRKKHHVMRFNATLNVDFAQWRSVKLERENNMREFKGAEEDMPKFGAGSEYNRDLREEVRRKKFGIIAKKYRPEAQPWILKVGGKSGKKFKGIREGGVSENAAFYVFTHAPDGAIEAYPLNEWYNFQPIQRYKSLSAEEAEQEFGRRKKVMNYFSLMLRKRLKGDEEEEKDPDEVKVKGAGSKKSKELKISEMDEWIDSEEESDSDSDEEDKKKKDADSDDEGKKKGKKGKDGEKKKKKRDVDDEAFEESDDGDEEGREMDYDTESSEDEPDPEAKLDKDMKSVAEEDALRKLLTSDEDEDEENKSDDSDKEDEEKKKKDKSKEEGKEKKKNKSKTKDSKKDSSSDFSSDSSDSEIESKQKKKGSSKPPSKQNSRSATPTFNNDASKRKLNSMPGDLTASENSNSPISTPSKRPKTESLTPSLPSTFAGVVNTNNKDDYGITEEAVRRYLMRKPMTATELLTKFKNKKTGVSSDRLVETMTQILKKINPVKQTIQGKMYLSIKVNK